MSQNYKIINLEETESTNLYLKNLIQEKHIDECMVVKTDLQTKGRGQMGNSWISERGKNLLFSFIIYPKYILANEQFVISEMVSLALSKVLSGYVEDIKIKWPNDIYWRDKKIAGVLIENNLIGKSIDSSIIGIGLNVNQEIFPEFLLNPVSLKIITNENYDRNILLIQFMDEFCKLYKNLISIDWLSLKENYMKELYRSDGFYWFEDLGGRFLAKIINVMPSGHIIMQANGEEELRTYAFKEISFVNSI